ncbi:hypothetical protein GFN93_07245 [Alcanivorax sp. PA15-N-34]|uniref:Uncharacterized protein n=2 Tax=Alcanivorax sediminis TaxID=2663008 RepID=A0A6N7LXR2_9GAMM|nr:hypothetical protein [Alcanivorax sediminis]
MLSTYVLLLLISVVSSWGKYDFYYFASVGVMLLGGGQVYLMLVMDKFYFGMGVELEKGWGDSDIRLMKVLLLATYIFVVLGASFYAYLPG